MVLDTAKSARPSYNTITCGISSGRLLGTRILALMQPRFLQASGLGWQDAIVLILLAACALPGGRRTSLESSRSLVFHDMRNALFNCNTSTLRRQNPVASKRRCQQPMSP